MSKYLGFRIRPKFTSRDRSWLVESVLAKVRKNRPIRNNYHAKFKSSSNSSQHRYHEHEVATSTNAARSEGPRLGFEFEFRMGRTFWRDPKSKNTAQKWAKTQAQLSDSTHLLNERFDSLIRFFDSILFALLRRKQVQA